MLSTMPRTLGSCSRFVRSVSTVTKEPSSQRIRNSTVPVCPSPSLTDERNESTRVLSSGWISSANLVPSSRSGSKPSTRCADGLAYRDGRVELDDGHDVRRVLHERGEPRLALLQQQVLGQRGALQRQRHLRGQGAERVGDVRGISSGVATTIRPWSSSRMNSGATKTEPSSSSGRASGSRSVLSYAATGRRRSRAAVRASTPGGLAKREPRADDVGAPARRGDHLESSRPSRSSHIRMAASGPRRGTGRPRSRPRGCRRGSWP